MERCPTGIRELDQMMRGGIPSGNLVLLAGGSGTGKTTLGLEFLAHGAEMGDAGLFMAVTEPVETLRRTSEGFLFLKPELLETGKVRLVDLRDVLTRLGVEDHAGRLPDPGAVVDAIAAIVEQYKIRRLVIDSLTALCYRLTDAAHIRDFAFRLGRVLGDAKCTTILTSETPPRTHVYSPFGVEEFIADGIIFLSELERKNDLVRTLQIMKMRGTEHSRARFMMDLSEFGISLAPLLKRLSSD